MRRVEWFFGSWRFPVFAFSLLVGGTAVLATLLLTPAGGGALAQFAEDFRTWCFGYDAATGKVEVAYIGSMVIQPVVIAVVLFAVWRGPLAELVAGGLRRALPWAAAALVLTVGGAGLLGIVWSPDARGELPFPAERLRTTHAAPSFTLTDHTGAQISVKELRGRVVVLTGVYASCGHTCPMILQQVRRSVAALTPEARAHVTVLGVTLDPENDDPARLASLLGHHQIGAPTFRLLTGEPGRVNAVLDDLGITRTRDPETGVIDHANLYTVIDAGGRIAYRFTLGERQERWLTTALGHLAREAAAISPGALAAASPGG